MTDEETPITLEEACRLYPQASFKVSTLRAANDAGRLDIFRLGRRYHTTRSAMADWVQRCRRKGCSHLRHCFYYVWATLKPRTPQEHRPVSVPYLCHGVDMNITDTRRAIAVHARQMAPSSDEHRAATSLLNALRNVEEHPDVPLMRRFLAEDLARAETVLTPRHGRP